MRDRNRVGQADGFSLIELIAVIAIFGIVATMIVPPIQQMIHRSKIEGFANASALMIQQARFEAIKRSIPCVVQPDVANGRMFAFADVHGTAVTDPPDGIFNPIAAAPFRTTDYRIQEQSFPSGLSFAAPGFTGLASVDGFVNAGAPDKQAILQADGSALSAGAIRVADVRGNFLEIRIAPAATARVQIRKWSPDDSAWLASGELDKPWEWM